MAGHLNVDGLAANTTPAPVAKVKYQRTTKGRKSQKVNLMLAAAAEDLSPIPGATSPLHALQHQQQRGTFGPPSVGQHGMVGNYGHGMGGGPFMEGSGGGFPHHFYNHSMQEGSPPSYYGGEGHQHLMGGGHGMRGLPSFEQDFLRGQHHQQQGHQQQQRPFYTTAGMNGGGGLGGGMKQHSMDPHEQDYDALHRQHLSPTATVITGGGVLKSDPNNNCDFSEMRMFNGGGGSVGIKSEFTSEDQTVSGGGGGRMSSPMTNTNATTPEDVLEEL